jgi:hypothetical protein
VTLEVFGLTIHEADVALTDIGLALLGGWIAWQLWRQPSRREVQEDGARINAGLAVAALCGAIYHAFFPAIDGVRGGRPVWLATTTAIALATASMLTLGMRLLLPLVPRRALFAAILVVAFVGTIAFLDPSYRTVVLFYGPVLLLLLIAAVRQARRTGASGWWSIVAGLVLSIVAAGLQQARVALHPVYADHNALYHLVQAVALIVLHRGLRVV